jgi:hypothetical protein
MVNICTIVNNIEASSYAGLEVGEVRLTIKAQLPKGDALSRTNVVAFSSIGRFGSTRNIHELGQVQVK